MRAILTGNMGNGSDERGMFNECNKDNVVGGIASDRR